MIAYASSPHYYGLGYPSPRYASNGRYATNIRITTPLGEYSPPPTCRAASEAWCPTTSSLRLATTPSSTSCRDGRRIAKGHATTPPSHQNMPHQNAHAAREERRPTNSSAKKTLLVIPTATDETPTNTTSPPATPSETGTEEEEEEPGWKIKLRIDWRSEEASRWYCRRVATRPQDLSGPSPIDGLRTRFPHAKTPLTC